MFGDQISSNIVWWSNILPFSHLVWCCLIVSGRVWKNLKAIKHSIKQLKTFISFPCLMGDVLFVWTAVSNMFGARMRPTLAQRPVSIVWSVFDQTCLNRLATHFNISMFGYQNCLMLFGRQTFTVWIGLKVRTNYGIFNIRIKGPKVWNSISENPNT